METSASAPHAALERIRSQWRTGVVTDPAELEYFATDVYASGEPLLLRWDLLRDRVEWRGARATAAPD